MGLACSAFRTCFHRTAVWFTTESSWQSTCSTDCMESRFWSMPACWRLYHHVKKNRRELSTSMLHEFAFCRIQFFPKIMLRCLHQGALDTNGPLKQSVSSFSWGGCTGL